MKGADTEYLSRVVNAYKPLSKAVEQRVARRYKQHKRRADRDMLLNSNLRFVLREAHRYAGYQHPLDDLFQVGVEALCKALDSYDPDDKSGARFVRYAQDRIRRAISAEVAYHWSVVRLAPKRVLRHSFFKIRYLLSTGAEDQEIANEVGAALRDVALIRSRLEAGPIDAGVDELTTPPQETTDSADLLRALQVVVKRIVRRGSAHRAVLCGLVDGTSMGELARRLEATPRQLASIQSLIVADLAEAAAPFIADFSIAEPFRVMVRRLCICAA